MEFLDEDERQGALRVARRAVALAAVSMGTTLGAPILGLLLGPLFGAITGVIAVLLAGSSVATLRHPQASVVGGLRVAGLVVGGLVILIGALEVAGGIWQLVVGLHEHVGVLRQPVEERLSRSLSSLSLNHRQGF